MESKGAQLGFSLAGKKAVGGGLASKQTKMLDNYLTYDLEKRMWESQKVGKGKTPALRNFFAWHYEYPRLLIHGGAVINPGDKKAKS